MNDCIQLLIEQENRINRAIRLHESTPKYYGTEDLLYSREADFIDYIGRSEKPTITEISKFNKVTKSAASQLCTKLISKGYIIKKQCVADKRVSILSLTEKGMAVFSFHSQLDLNAGRKAREVLSTMDIEDIKTIIEIKKVILNNFNEHIFF